MKNYYYYTSRLIRIVYWINFTIRMFSMTNIMCYWSTFMVTKYIIWVPMCNNSLCKDSLQPIGNKTTPLEIFTTF